jgi:hypothetical protein
VELSAKNLDDLPIFRPRMGGGQKSTSRSGSGWFPNALLSKVARGAGAARRRAAARSRVAVVRPDANARRVVVKVHVARLGAGGAKAAALHLRYIERDGVERDGSKGVAYTSDEPARVETFEQPRSGERHQFRFIGRRGGARSHRVRPALHGAGRARSRSQARMVGRQPFRHRPSPCAHRDPWCRPQRTRAPTRPGVHLERLARDRAGDRDAGARAAARARHPMRLCPGDHPRAVHLARSRARAARGRQPHRGPVSAAARADRRLDPGRAARAPRGDAPRGARLAIDVVDPGGMASRASSTGCARRHLETAPRRRARGPGPIPRRERRGGARARPRRGLRRRVGACRAQGLSDELKGRLYAVIETPTGHALHVPSTPGPPRTSVRAISCL